MSGIKNYRSFSIYDILSKFKEEQPQKIFCDNSDLKRITGKGISYISTMCEKGNRVFKYTGYKP